MPREALYTADELFFAGTATEVTPIRSVDGIPVGAGRVVPLTYDAAMRASMPPSILVNNTGALPGSGSATVGFPIPPITLAASPAAVESQAEWIAE